MNHQPLPATVTKIEFELDYEEVVEEYPHGVQIEKFQPLVDVDREGEPVEETDPNLKYRVKTPNAGRSPLFDFPDTARIWVDVYFDVGGFREEKTGERGVPPEVAAAGRDTLVAYLLTQRGMSRTWASRFFDYDRETIHSYLSRVRSRARDTREELSDEDTHA